MKLGLALLAFVGPVAAQNAVNEATVLSPDGVVVVNPFGMAIHDVAVAEAVARAALVLGLGRNLER